MKKLLLILAISIFSLAGGIIFAACNQDSSEEKTEIPPVAPTLEKSSFAITYRTTEDGAQYNLSWSAKNAKEYKVQLDETETVTTETKFSLNGFSADTIHTVTVTAIGQKDTQSDPVELKFKGTKIDPLINVRLYSEHGETNFGWKESEETSCYLISCEELDLDVATSKPFGTGKFKTTLHYDNRASIGTLRSIYKYLDLYSLESFRVQALPYNGNMETFNYKNDTDVLEFNLPSDLSEQSVNFYAGTMSNPTNIRWNTDEWEEHPDWLGVKWDGAVSYYRYWVKVDYPEGYSSGTVTEAGESTSLIHVSYGDKTGDYTVSVIPKYDDFNYLGKDENSVTYMFYLQPDVTETLSFHVNQTVLKTPTNIRVEGENIVWDAVEYTDYYSIGLEDGTQEIYVSSETAQVSLQEFFERAYEANYDGDFSIIVKAYGINRTIAGFENNVPVVNVYYYSEDAVSSQKIKLKSIPTVQNVQIDYENSTVTWDDIAEATGYTVMFYREGGSGHGSTLGKTNQYTWNDDISEYAEIVITASCEYQVTTENGVTTLYMPSSHRIQL